MHHPASKELISLLFSSKYGAILLIHPGAEYGS